MKTSSFITIQAPLFEVFSVASDLPSWPGFLLHYRYNRFISRMPWGGLVKMAAMRTGIPIQWISVYRIDTALRQMQFEHVAGPARGMKVVWQFDGDENSTQIEIIHEFQHPWPIIGPFIASVVIGWFFIQHVAGKTLRGLKRRMEQPTA